MIDLRLDPTTHDLVYSNFTFETVESESEEIAQRLKIKLSWFKGEWFLDENYGIPYFQEIFVKGIDLDDIDDIYRTQIIQEDGVIDLLSYDSDFNSSTRKLEVQAKYKSEDGEIQTISFAL